MKSLPISAALVALLVLLPECWAQAPILSTPLEDTVSPQLIQPLTQASAASNRGGQAGYGRVMWSIQPQSAAVGAALPLLTAPPQPATGSASPRLPVTRDTATSASRWIAGSGSLSGSMMDRGANPAQTSAYLPASSFTFGALSSQGALPTPGSAMAMSPITAQTSQARTILNHYQPAPSMVEDERAGGLATGPHPTSTGQSDAADASPPVTPFQAPSSALTGSFTRRGVQAPIVTTLTSAGMQIHLIATADGLQLVLQTKNAINGSILGDQSGTSRHSGTAAKGWWAWGAGAGSWAPVDPLTAAPLMNLQDDREEPINGSAPDSKLNQTPGSANRPLLER
jgi:hypothetical protein